MLFKNDNLLHKVQFSLISLYMLKWLIIFQHEVWPDYRKNTQTLGELWLGFFRYFVEEFDISGHVVTIRQQKPLTKFEKLWNGKVIAIEGRSIFCS